MRIALISDQTDRIFYENTHEMNISGAFFIKTCEDFVFINDYYEITDHY